MVQGHSRKCRCKVSPALVMHGLKWLVSKVNYSIVVTELCLSISDIFSSLADIVFCQSGCEMCWQPRCWFKPGTRLWNAALWNERENASHRKLLCLKYCSAGNRKTRRCNSAVLCIHSSTQRERIYVTPSLNGDFGISSEKEWLLPSSETKVFTLT